MGICDDVKPIASAFLEKTAAEMSMEKEMRTVMVSNLHYKCTKDKLNDFFAPLGSCFDIRILKDKSGKAKGMAYVEFTDRSHAMEAVKFTGRRLLDKPVGVNGTDLTQIAYEGLSFEDKAKKGLLSDPQTRVHINNVSPHVAEEELRRLLEVFGSLHTMVLEKDPISGVSRGYCTAQFNHAMSAYKAVVSMDGLKLDGSILHVSYAEEEHVEKIPPPPPRMVLNEPSLAGGVFPQPPSEPESEDELLYQESAPAISKKTALPPKHVNTTSFEPPMREAPLRDFEPPMRETKKRERPRTDNRCSR
eukprot:TRINITY_DN666_c0_g1_i2.p1 TRINITY_DN666_c0_g1~~TRINITY_DN666_c0_g1_i2.p1  ORF type:complete len:304 (+),score=73.75 TRINITY_DN666_c0_g1_i2:137-1048(+)